MNKDLEILAIDCQATHSNPDKGHILEIGWVKTRAVDSPHVERIAQKVEQFLLKIPRGVSIPKAVLRITGITHEELKSAHPSKEIWQRLSQMAESTAIKMKTVACPAVIHYCRYEEPFLRKLHEKFSPKKEFPLSIVCTHEIVRRLLPELPRKSLRAVAGYFGLSLPQSRRSLQHVVGTALIWHHLVKLLEDQHGIHTFHDLQEWLRQPASLLSNHKRAREYPMDEAYRKDLPNLPGVYKMYRSGGDLLYIGKAKSLKQRISSYFHKGSRHPEHILEMLSQAKSLETTVTSTSIEASLVESDEIKRLSPPYNRALRKNERGILFFSRDLKSSNPQPDSCHSVGPLPSSYYLNSLVMLGDVLNGSVKKVSLKVIEGILDIPSEYLPDRDCFVSGLKTFKQEFQKFLQPAFNLATLMAMGTRFWKEKLEEQAAEEDITDDSEAEEILELKMQESEEKEVLDTWTPERIVKVLKNIIRLGAFQIRRSRWFCRLSESSLAWTTLVRDVEGRNLIVFKGGIPHFKDLLSPSETIPVPPAHTKSLFERQKNFDLFAYDRMRVTTTEIRRLIQEDRTVELCLHPDVCLRKEQLKKILQWV